MDFYSILGVNSNTNEKDLKMAFRDKTLNCNDNDIYNYTNAFENIMNNMRSNNGPSVAIGVDVHGIDMPNLDSMMNIINSNPFLKNKCKEELHAMEEMGMNDMLKSMSHIMGCNLEDKFSNLKKKFMDEEDKVDRVEILDIDNDNCSNITSKDIDKIEVELVNISTEISLDKFYNGFYLYDIEDKNILDDLKLKTENRYIEPGTLEIINKDECYKLKFNLLKHEHFYYENNKLYYNHKISLKESLCGFEFNLKHLNGKTYLIKNYNKIIKPYSEICLPNLGINKEDLTIKFDIIFPNKLNEDQIKQLELIFNDSIIS
jgi:hypothetical protein